VESPPSYVAIDPEVLRRLYVDERLTSSQIARRLGCAEITVLRRLRQFAIPARPRGPLSQAKTLNGDIRWSPNLAYAVGLLATDGNLSGDGRHLSLTSKDRDLLETFRACLNISAAITPHRGGHGGTNLRVQWGDRHFYNWLVNIGLTPAKSLTLRPLAIPDVVFVDFLRGCIDGDGSVTVYVDRYNMKKSERYVYERLYVKLVSASRPFLEWIQATAHRVLSMRGSIVVKRAEGRSPMWTLSYAKAESIELLRRIYYSPTVPGLARKRAKAERFLSPLGYISVRSVGRPRVGWVYNQRAPDPLETCAGVMQLARHGGLKNPCPQGRAGSNPAPGTKIAASLTTFRATL
jgi:hypothetical protein